MHWKLCCTLEHQGEPGIFSKQMTNDSRGNDFFFYLAASFQMREDLVFDPKMLILRNIIQTFLPKFRHMQFYYVLYVFLGRSHQYILLPHKKLHSLLVAVLKETTFAFLRKQIKQLHRSKIWCVDSSVTSKIPTFQKQKTLKQWFHCLYGNVVTVCRNNIVILWSQSIKFCLSIRHLALSQDPVSTPGVDLHHIKLRFKHNKVSA